MTLEKTHVSDGIVVFTGRHPTGIGVTSTMVSSEGDAFIFNTLYYPDDTRELLQSVKKMGLNPAGLINTHWHIDHTAGNQLMFQVNRIISYSLCIDLMRTDLHEQIEDLKKRSQR